MFTVTERKPTHPGAVLREDVLKPLGLTVTKAAKLLGISRKCLSEFLNEKSSLSVDMAYRISVATNTSVQSWLDMQTKLTLWNLQNEKIENVQPMSMVC